MTRPPTGELGLVAAGSALGALARWTVVPAEQGAAFPWATLAVNLAGAFVLGALPALTAVRRSRRLALLLGPGVLAGFTTVSAWSGQVTVLASGGRELLAGAYVAATLAGTLLAASLGRRCAGAGGEVAR